MFLLFLILLIGIWNSLPFFLEWGVKGAAEDAGYPEFEMKVTQLDPWKTKILNLSTGTDQDLLKISQIDAEILKKSLNQSEITFENKIDKIKKLESSDLSNQVIFARVDEIIKLNLADEYFNAFFQDKDSCILIFIGDGSKILNKNSIYLEEKFDFFSEISFFEENANLICDSGFNFNYLGKSQEVSFLPKKPKNKGFFEKFFNFFN